MIFSERGLEACAFSLRHARRTPEEELRTNLEGGGNGPAWWNPVTPVSLLSTPFGELPRSALVTQLQLLLGEDDYRA